MSDIAIRVEGLSKQYRIGAKAVPYLSLRDSLSELGAKVFGFFSRNGQKDHEQTLLWALKDVSFEVKQGEVIGVIGRNGAGKTTLLKILSRITEPTEGRAEVHGRVASLLEVGTGFHPELTGRENIFLSGAILGMRRAEIRAKFDDIVEFAGVEQFIDTPAKRYSSGMYLRLAFSVAAHLEPEIVLVDEVLAVGDANFQKKCLGKMQDVASEGRTVLFVSHNMAAVQRLCTRAIALDGGRIICSGSTGQVIQKYLSSGTERVAERSWIDSGLRPGNEVVCLLAVRATNKDGKVSVEFSIHQPINVEMEYEVLAPNCVLRPDFHFFDEHGTLVFVSMGYHGNIWADRIRPAGRYRDICHIPGDFLNEGQFTVLAAIQTPPWGTHFAERDVISFQVLDDFNGGARGNYPRDWPGGVVRPLLQWTSRLIQTKHNNLQEES